MRPEERPAAASAPATCTPSWPTDPALASDASSVHPLVFSPLYCGGPAAGYQQTENYCGKQLTLADAMAISGSALTPFMVDNIFFCALLAAFNLRIGQWLRDEGEAYARKLKEAGVMPEDTVRWCVIGDGAEWIWKHVQALFPHACQVLDYYHCSEYLHKVAKAQYSDPLHALEWVEATLTRLYMGKGGWVLGGLRRMQPTSEEALKAIDNCWVYLNDHRGRTHYRTFRRGGYPLGSGGMESSNKCICHVRLKRSGAWWYEVNSNQMLALRCAKYNGTFHQLFTRHQRQKSAA